MSFTSSSDVKQTPLPGLRHPDSGVSISEPRVSVAIRTERRQPACISNTKSKKAADLRPLYLKNALGSGTSPAAPNCWISVPAVERWMNHVEFEGRKTPASVLPSPS